MQGGKVRASAPCSFALAALKILAAFKLHQLKRGKGKGKASRAGLR